MRHSVRGRPGNDLLFQALRLSTIGAEDFDGRVRDGIGYRLLAMATRPAKNECRSPVATTRGTGFEVGFPLRRLQRLSRPYVATLHCGWRHNSSTRGTSIPVLSY